MLFYARPCMLLYVLVFDFKFYRLKKKVKEDKLLIIKKEWHDYMLCTQIFKQIPATFGKINFLKIFNMLHVFLFVDYRFSVRKYYFALYFIRLT